MCEENGCYYCLDGLLMMMIMMMVSRFNSLLLLFERSAFFYCLLLVLRSDQRRVALSADFRSVVCLSSVYTTQRLSPMKGMSKASV